MPRTIAGITARNMRPLSIGVTTGTHGQNRLAFKQSIQARAPGVYRIEGCRPARSASSATHRASAAE